MPIQKQGDTIDARDNFILGFSLTTFGLLAVLGGTGYVAVERLNGIASQFYHEGWLMTTLINSGATALWWYLIWPAWIQWQTRITSAGITQARFFGRRVIQWSEVRTIEIMQTNDIKISASHDQIIIKPLLIVDARAMLEVMRQYLPPEQVPTLGIPLDPKI